jgi:hypothetical protein
VATDTVYGSQCGGSFEILTLKQTNNENGNVTTTSAQAHPIKILPHMPGSVGALSSAGTENEKQTL